MKVIGIGQCGNNNVANLIINGVIDKNDALMLNTTNKDIPEMFKEIGIEFGDGIGGSGKERAKAHKALMYSFQNGDLNILDSLITDEDDTVYIITSSEGGTGSGSAITIGKYFKSVHNMNVHLIVFTGYEEDIRGLRNTIDFFSELDDEFIVQVISNKKFLKDANNNKVLANRMANDELARKLQIILGKLMIPSEVNIDDTDLYKLTTTSGLITVEYSYLDRNIKNQEEFNKVLSSIIDNSKSIDVINPGAQRIGVVINAGENTREIIDYSFDILKKKYGVPIELYTHIQDDGNQEFINIISSGMRLPLEELNDILEKYEENISKVRTKDDFFDSIRKFELSDIDKFNIKEASVPTDVKSKKNDFLKNMSSNSADNVQVKTTEDKKLSFLQKENDNKTSGY